MAAGLMGARVFYLLETFDRTIEHPAVILDVFGPTTSWGAYLAGLTAYFAYFKLNKIPSSGYADAFGSSLGLGPFIGRWSCFLHGCCYGTVSEVPWAIRFPAGSPPYTDHFQHDWIATDSAFSLPVHPLQIYLSASALLVFWLSSRAFRVLKSAPGLTFLSYWFLYCLFRFPLEYVRADAARYGPLRFDLAQIVCLVACTAIAVVMTVRYPIRKAPTASGP
jgi:phosphatidylglycerol:prolipoprotein diacylglycerol transferase